MKLVDHIRSDLDDRGSTVKVEILAGITSFLSLAYIFVVNPSILSQAGMDPTAVLFATVIASGAATIAMGVWARLPFVLAPGLEMNAYVAFVVVGAMGFTWQQGLGAVAWSGILFVVLTHFQIREAIISSIPDKMKFALALSVGAFVFTIGMHLSKVVIYESQTIAGVSGLFMTGVGGLDSPEALVLVVGLVLIIVLEKLKIPFLSRGGVLIAIIGSAMYLLSGKPDDLVLPQPADGSMFSAIFAADMIPPTGAGLSFVSAVLILFLIDFYGSIAKFIGMTMNTEIRTLDNQGRSVVPRTHQALMMDGSGTCLGAALGTTSITTYVESAVGIAAGGRTGLTAIVCGLLMFAVLPFAQYIQYIPVEATTGALLYVGYRLIPRREIWQSYDKWDWAVAIGMPLLVFLTFSLDFALILGFIVYGGIQYRDNKTVPWFMFASALALVVGRALQFAGT